jgi:hypothetical protein
VTRKAPVPRKKRTRQHVIAAQSVNYVERFIIDKGHTAERFANDYGYDLVLYTYDKEGYAEEGAIYLQLKTSEKLKVSGDNFVFDMEIQDYMRWTREPMPVFLVLFDASKRRAYWLYVQRYFDEVSSRKPRQGARTVRVPVPKRQAVNRTAIRTMRAYKQRVLEQLEGAIDHV